MRNSLRSSALGAILLFGCASERTLDDVGSIGAAASDDIRYLNPQDHSDEEEEGDEGGEGGGEGGGESGGYEEEEHFDMALEEPPEEQPDCEPGTYGCGCIDPGVYCNEGLVCMGGTTCGCDQLGTIHCPCNIDECDDGLSCDDLGFCEP